MNKNLNHPINHQPPSLPPPTFTDVINGQPPRHQSWPPLSPDLHTAGNPSQSHRPSQSHQPPSLHHKLKNKKTHQGQSRCRSLWIWTAPPRSVTLDRSTSTTTTRHYYRSFSLSSTTKQNSNNYSQQKSNQNKSKRSEWQKQRVRPKIQLCRMLFG